MVEESEERALGILKEIKFSEVLEDSSVNFKVGVVIKAKLICGSQPEMG